MPRVVSEEDQDVVAYVAKLRPDLGARDLRTWLLRRWPKDAWPNATDIAAILERRDIVPPPGRGQPSKPRAGKRFAAATAPNVVWYVEVGPPIATADGKSYTPITVTDGFSGLCIRCELAVELDPDGLNRILESAFREVGLPATLRTANAPPFAGEGPVGLTELAVWLLRMGLRLERVSPRKVPPKGPFRPALEVQPDGRVLQRALDLARREHNRARAERYAPSSLRYPGARILITRAPYNRDVKVDKNGRINHLGHRVLLTKALYGETVELTPVGKDRWDVYLARLVLGTLVGRVPPRFEPVPWEQGPHHVELDPFYRDMY
jgi:hypothetical protein